MERKWILFLGPPLSPFIGEGILSVIGVNNLWSMDLVSRFPSVISLGVALPFDEVLKGSSPAEVSMINNPFNLVFFFSSDKVRRGSRIVWSMCGRFAIG